MERQMGEEKAEEEGEEGEVGKSEDSNATGQNRARVISLRDPGGLE